MNARTKNALLLIVAVTAVVLAALGGRQLALAGAGTGTTPPGPEAPYTDRFSIADCTFSTTGSNPYFILQPNYRLLLRGEEAGTAVETNVTVLNETRLVDGVLTRVVEERALEDGVIIEISRNYFAICSQTNSVFYFGEDVDIYAGGVVVNHSGAWLSGANGARAGVFMPGIVLLGSRYFQEVAPGVAMDRAEVVSLSERLVTPAGTFTDVLKTKETTPLDSSLLDYKQYAEGVGLIQDGVTLLEEYGYI